MSSKRTPRLWLAFLCGLVVALKAADLWAQVPVCDPKDKELCATPLKAGDEAPYAGQLLTTKLAIQLGQQAEYGEARVKLAADAQVAQLKIDLSLANRFLEIERETREHERNMLMDKLREASASPWYERPWFVATATTVIVGTVAAVLMWAVLAHEPGAARIEVVSGVPTTLGFGF